MKSKPSQSAVLRAARIIAFVAKNPLREARAIVAACVAEEMLGAPRPR